MQTSEPSPRALVDRLFVRFTAMYGTQKVMSMWSDADLDMVKDTWASAIGRYSVPSIAVAVSELLNSGREWPPTLPEFVELCRRGALVRQQSQAPALPAPGGTYTTREEAAAILQRIGAADVLDSSGRGPKAWARKILSRMAAGEHVPPAVQTMAKAGLT